MLGKKTATNAKGNAVAGSHAIVVALLFFKPQNGRARRA